MDTTIFVFIALFAGMTVWVSFLVKSLDRRLRNLEKQHLALVAEIEQRLYQE